MASMKMQWRIPLVICDLLVVTLILLPFVWPDATRSPSPYDQSVQVGMSFDEAIAKLGNPQLQDAFWKKADGNLMVFSDKGDRIISSVHFTPEKMGPAGLSPQQYLAIGIAVLGILLGFLVLPPDVQGWRSIVLTISVPTLYGLGAAGLSAMAWAWLNGLLSK